MASVMSDKKHLVYAFFSNLRIPMALRRKLRLVRDNNVTKIRTLSLCCGNYEQPGC